jgi:hypothetical protein
MSTEPTDIESSIRTTAGGDVRTRLAKGALTALDAGESLVKSGFAVARRVTQRLDGALAELLAGVQRIVAPRGN